LGANSLAGLSAEQVVDRLPGRFAHDIPQGDVDRADRLNCHAFTAIVDTLAEHALPQDLDVERILIEHDVLEVILDRVARVAVANTHTADAGDPLISHQLHQQQGDRQTVRLAVALRLVEDAPGHDHHPAAPLCPRGSPLAPPA